MNNLKPFHLAFPVHGLKKARRTDRLFILDTSENALKFKAFADRPALFATC